MSAQRSSLRSFLINAKSSLQNAIISQQRVTLVLGNESADLDSITSAIVFSYIRSSAIQTPLTNQSVNKHTPPSQYPPLYIPLLNIPRADIKIRPELLALLPHANLEPDHLITLDDLTTEPPAGLSPDGRQTLSPNFARLILTDFNKLAGPLAQKGFAKQVVGVIDHHVDEGTVPRDTGSEPRIIKTSGSCTSLVVDYLRSKWDSLSDSASSSGAAVGQTDTGAGADDEAVRRTWDAQIAKLAIASVLVDTAGLKDERKTTPVDRKTVDYLEARIALAPAPVSAGWDRANFLKEVNDARFNLDGLSVEDCLRKDYKAWDATGKTLGVSAVVKPLSWMVDKAGSVEKLRAEMLQFAKKRDVDLFAVMTTSTSESGEFQRELLLWSINPDSDKILEQFEGDYNDQLGLEAWNEQFDLDSTDSETGSLKVWWQREVSNSRKQVAPLLRKSLEQNKASI